MRSIILLVISFLLCNVQVVWADHAEHVHEAEEAGLTVRAAGPPAEVRVEPGQAVVEVEGIVCSFCAVGLNKNLSKLPFLDSDLFTKGVFTDIHKQQIVLALDPGRPLDLDRIHRAVMDSGYDPVAVHIRVSGVLERGDTGAMLTDEASGHRYVFKPRVLDSFPDGVTVELQVHINAADILSLVEGEPIPVFVNRVEGDS